MGNNCTQTWCMFVHSTNEKKIEWNFSLKYEWKANTHRICAFSHHKMIYSLNWTISIMMNNKYNNHKNCLHKYLCFAFAFYFSALHNS